MEPKDKLLPCQQAMLATREDINGWRVYRCEIQGLACMVTGCEPDAAMLELVCEECVKKAPPGSG